MITHTHHTLLGRRSSQQRCPQQWGNWKHRHGLFSVLELSNGIVDTSCILAAETTLSLLLCTSALRVCVALLHATIDRPPQDEASAPPPL